MEAARIARLRGHDVSIWERDDRLGGKLDVASRAPSKREVLRFRDYQARRLAELGVEIHTGVEVTPELVAAEEPDVVVVATGAEPLFPPIPGIDGAHRRRRPGDPLRPRAGRAGRARRRSSAAARPAARPRSCWSTSGVDVTIVEMRLESATASRRSPAGTCFASCKQRGVQILTDAEGDRDRAGPRPLRGRRGRRASRRGRTSSRWRSAGARAATSSPSSSTDARWSSSATRRGPPTSSPRSTRAPTPAWPCSSAGSRGVKGTASPPLLTGSGRDCTVGGGTGAGPPAG